MLTKIRQGLDAAAALWRRIPVIGHLTIRHMLWVHFKLAMILFLTTYGANTPPATAAALDGPIRWLWLGMGAAGAVVSVVGLVLAVQPGERSRKRGTQIELAGLGLMIVGPLIYASTQFAIASANEIENAGVRFGVAWLGYSLFAAVIARIGQVMPRYQRTMGDMLPKHPKDDA